MRERGDCAIRTVSLGYFLDIGIPLRKGRFFTEDDWKVPRAVINETMDGVSGQGRRTREAHQPVFA